MSTEPAEIDDGKWTVRLRDDQMDCVIECLTWIIGRHEMRIKHVDAMSLDEFAHRQSKARLADALAIFTEVDHRP